ncbi:MAG: hypothetical protein NZ878_13535, partial [SAR324 cluster bacterium]|nr:hypothetical protein [SAR324 cluster bacterium]
FTFCYCTGYISQTHPGQGIIRHHYPQMALFLIASLKELLRIRKVQIQMAHCTNDSLQSLSGIQWILKPT